VNPAHGVRLLRRFDNGKVGDGRAEAAGCRSSGSVMVCPVGLLLAPVRARRQLALRAIREGRPSRALPEYLNKEIVRVE